VRSYYPIIVHEEAGVECAHEQLLADRFRLGYRDTSLPSSSVMTQILPGTQSWVSAWLESFFRSTFELLLDVVGRRRRNSLLGEERNRWERCSSGRVAKTSWRKNKSGGAAELGRT
jgi:hypothetical protein